MRAILLPLAGLAALAALLLLTPLRDSTLKAARRLAGPGATRASAESAAGSSAASNATPQESRPERKTARLPVAGIVVEPTNFTITVRGAGRAEAERRAEVSTRVGERVSSVPVREGDRVREGQPLVELDRLPYELELKSAEAALAQSELEYDAQLFADDSASAEKRERVKAKTGVTAAEQRVSRAQLDLDGTTVRAPFAGEISRVDAVVGERVAPDKPVATVVDRSRVRIPVDVLETDFARLKAGAGVLATLPALPGRRFVGRIAALSPELDPSRNAGLAYVVLENPERAIAPGMYCDVEITADELPNRLSVPRAAVLERSRRLLVFRAKAGRAEWSYVETGLETADRIEILKGVDPGDTVLVDGHLTLAHGAPIQVEIVDPASGR